MDSEAKFSKLAEDDSIYRFYSTIEGRIIEFIRSRGQVTLVELIAYIDYHKNKLRDISSRKYKEKSIETLVISTLIYKKQIFNEVSDGNWTINIDSALEYEKNVIKKIEHSCKKRVEQHKKYKSKLHEEEKFKVFENLVDNDIYNKLIQLDELMASSNEQVQKQILEYYDSSKNISINR
ncbi:unnamed protein product [Blepharisma stoltei]|uniref:Uncharacterized protein n=1 Tax=Blepharisma stoltei TaxID=1481888 RepID=A0AAU9IBW7_9CILI|nr:unnamed protein product [Blepharisma stoltei]